MRKRNTALTSLKQSLVNNSLAAPIASGEPLHCSTLDGELAINLTLVNALPAAPGLVPMWKTRVVTLSPQSHVLHVSSAMGSLVH